MGAQCFGKLLPTLSFEAEFAEQASLAPVLLILSVQQIIPDLCRIDDGGFSLRQAAQADRSPDCKVTTA